MASGDFLRPGPGEGIMVDSLGTPFEEPWRSAGNGECLYTEAAARDSNSELLTAVLRQRIGTAVLAGLPEAPALAA